jgi:hypothetical protein
MEKKLGWKMEKYMKLMIFSLKINNNNAIRTITGIDIYVKGCLLL